MQADPENVEKPGPSQEDGAPAEDGNLEGTPEEEAALEASRLSLEKELHETEEMLRSLQSEQATQVSELENLKENFRSELSGLRADSWKLAEFAELEQIKNSLLTPHGTDPVEDADAVPPDTSTLTWNTGYDSPVLFLASFLVGQRRLGSAFQNRFTPNSFPLWVLIDRLVSSEWFQAARASRDEMEQRKKELADELQMFATAITEEADGLSINGERRNVVG
eukprot:gene13029-15392_t